MTEAFGELLDSGLCGIHSVLVESKCDDGRKWQMIELFLIEFILKVKWSVLTPQDAGEKTDYFWEKLFQNSVVWINLDNQLHKYIVNIYVF